MKKNLIYSGILVGVLLVSLVSAGWFTGNAVDDSVTINIYGNARYDKKFEFDGVSYAVGADFSDDGKEVYLIMTNSELMIVEKLKPLYETGVASFGESFGYMKIEVTRVRESWIRGDYASLVISKGEEPKCKEGYILMKEGCVILSSTGGSGSETGVSPSTSGGGEGVVTQTQSGEVTYAGVLEMLRKGNIGSFRVTNSSQDFLKNHTCSELCMLDGKVCVAAYYLSKLKHTPNSYKPYSIYPGDSFEPWGCNANGNMMNLENIDLFIQCRCVSVY